MLLKRWNQKAESWFNTAPLAGMGSGKMTSKAESRSVTTKSKVSPRSKTSRTFPLRSFLIPGRSTFESGVVGICATSLAHGWNRRQTPCANFARTRLGFFRGSAQSLRESQRWRRHFAEGRARSPDRQRDLQQQIANRGAAILAAPPGPGSRFFPEKNLPGNRIQEAARGGSTPLPGRLERERWIARGNR